MLPKFQLLYRGSSFLHLLMNIKYGPDQISFNPLMSIVIFGIPHPLHTFSAESRPDFALKSRILSFK